MKRRIKNSLYCLDCGVVFQSSYDLHKMEQDTSCPDCECMAVIKLTNKFAVMVSVDDLPTLKGGYKYEL